MKIAHTYIHLPMHPCVHLSIYIHIYADHGSTHGRLQENIRRRRRARSFVLGGCPRKRAVSAPGGRRRSGRRGRCCPYDSRVRSLCLIVFPGQRLSLIMFCGGDFIFCCLLAMHRQVYHMTRYHVTRCRRTHTKFFVPLDEFVCL